MKTLKRPYSRVSRPLTSVCAICLVVVGGGFAFNEASGQDVSGVAERELAKRQAAINESMQLVQEGDVLRSGGELESAAASYRAAIELLPRAPATESLRGKAVDKYSSSAVDWAKELAAGGRYAEAKATLDGILVPGISPDYEPAKALRSQLDDPDYHNPALTAGHVKRVDQVIESITEAKGLVALGRFDEAIEAYRNVLRLDPYNSAARRGMEAIEIKLKDFTNAAYDHTRAAMLRMVDEGWETQIAEPSLGLGAEVDLEGTDGGVRRSTVARKVKSIIIPRVEFIEAKLKEVVEFMTAQSRLLDTSPGGNKGINIVLDTGTGGESLGERRISLSLDSLPLEAVLRYVTDLTGTRFRVEEFAVHIMDRGSEGLAALRTKSFRVPPNFISSNPADAGGGGEVDPFADPGDDAGGSGLVLKRISAKEFLEQSGISFGEGAEAAFLASTSQLVVTNTEEALDQVDSMVQAAFERSANQIKIDVVMLDTTEEVLNEFGVDSLVDWFNVPGSDRVFASGGTAGNMATSGAEWIAGPAGSPADYPLQSAAGWPLGYQPVTAGNRTAAQFVELENSIDGVLLNNNPVQAGNLSPGVFAVSGAFTDPQFQTVIRGLNQKKGIDITMSPSVITRSGQRATIKVIREFPYPTEFDPPEIPQSFGASDLLLIGAGSILSLGGGGNESFPVTPTTPTAFDVREVGTTLEVEPIIGPDGKSVELNLVPEFDEFEGFINYGTPITDGNRVLTENRITMPVFRQVKESVQVTVWDGQTVVIGGLLQQEILDGEDQTPILGDLPVVGRMFKSSVKKTVSRAIVFMVRVNIIDPGGNTIRGQAAR